MIRRYTAVGYNCKRFFISKFWKVNRRNSGVFFMSRIIVPRISNKLYLGESVKEMGRERDSGSIASVPSTGSVFT